VPPRAPAPLLISAVPLALLAVFTLKLHRDQSTRARNYGDLYHGNLILAGATPPLTASLPPASSAASPSPSPGQATLCVHGLDTVATAIPLVKLVSLAPAERVKRLRCNSQVALASRRWLELTRPPPLLPQRMGREWGPSGHDVIPSPPTPACHGTAFAEVNVDLLLFSCLTE
jgi:hypothetical protein